MLCPVTDRPLVSCLESRNGKSAALTTRDLFMQQCPPHAGVADFHVVVALWARKQETRRVKRHSRAVPSGSAGSWAFLSEPASGRRAARATCQSRTRLTRVRSSRATVHVVERHDCACHVPPDRSVNTMNGPAPRGTQLRQFGGHRPLNRTDPTSHTGPRAHAGGTSPPPCDCSRRVLPLGESRGIGDVREHLVGRTGDIDGRHYLLHRFTSSGSRLNRLAP